MDIRQLEYFLAVAEAHSILRAADRLYVSRQAVSKTITQLEDELKEELFVRNQNGASMTPAGIYFYSRASAIVADFNKLKKEMQESDHTYRPRINICMAPGAYNIYAQQIYEFSEAHRSEMDIHVDGCKESDCEAALTERRADMVLAFTPISSSMVDSSVVLETPAKILIHNNNPLASKEVLLPDDLWGTRMLTYTGGYEEGWWQPSTGSEIRSSDLTFLFSLLEQDKGVLPIAEAAIPSYLDFAAARPDPRQNDPWRVYCSMLTPSYYNLFMYNMLDEILTGVFLRK